MISVSSCFFLFVDSYVEEEVCALALHLHFFVFWGTRKFEDRGVKEFKNWRGGGGLPGFLEGEGIFVGVGSVPHYMS